jgi:hypothetical protein
VRPPRPHPGRRIGTHTLALKPRHTPAHPFDRNATQRGQDEHARAVAAVAADEAVAESAARTAAEVQAAQHKAEAAAKEAKLHAELERHRQLAAAQAAAKIEQAEEVARSGARRWRAEVAQAEEQAEHARALAALAADDALAESQAEQGARLTEEVARHRCSAAWKTMHFHIPRPCSMLAARPCCAVNTDPIGLSRARAPHRAEADEALAAEREARARAEAEVGSGHILAAHHLASASHHTGWFAECRSSWSWRRCSTLRPAGSRCLCAAQQRHSVCNASVSASECGRALRRPRRTRGSWPA